MGAIWHDADLDIYCSPEAAPYVRSWLIGQDLQQVFCGYSEVSHTYAMLEYHSDA